MSVSSFATERAREAAIEASRVRCALRSIVGVMADEDIHLDEGTKAGLFEAINLVGDHLESYAAGQLDLAERFDRSRPGRGGAL